MRDLKANYNIHVLSIVEPRVSGDRVTRIINKLGFNKSYRVEAVGFSRGIWLLWDDSCVTIDIMDTSNQHIHTNISIRNGSDSFYLT